MLGNAAGAFTRLRCPNIHRIPKIAEYPAPIPNPIARTIVATRVPEVMTVSTRPFQLFDAHPYISECVVFYLPCVTLPFIDSVSSWQLRYVSRAVHFSLSNFLEDSSTLRKGFVRPEPVVSVGKQSFPGTAEKGPNTRN